MIQVRVERPGMTCRLLLLSLLLLAAAPARAAEPADLVLVDGAVCTMDASRSWATALAVSGGRIAYVGTDEGALALRGPATRVVDLEGRMVLPGLHDAHVHLAEGGLELSLCYLGDLDSAAEALAAVERYAREHPEEEWIVGSGWELPWFPPEGPHREVLDRLVPGRPALLHASDGHNAWANTEALRRAGVTRDTPDPPNGRIVRDAAGEPTGTLREAAVDLVSSQLPPPPREKAAEALRRALRLAHAAGITSILDANTVPHLLQAYADLDARGELTVRVLAALEVEPARGVDQVAGLAQARDRAAGRRLRATAAKIFVDGVMESRTAAMVEPYSDGTGRGEMNLTPEDLDRLVAALAGAGFTVHFHAIGDRAVQASLDSVERSGIRGLRHSLAHLELIRPEDVPRFRRLGVVADFQPLWAYADEYITKMTEPGLGPERSSRLYPLGTVARSGAVVAGGSDWTVSSLNPLEAIEVAVTRRDPAAGPGPAWLPDERISLMEALAAYTVNAAWALGQEGATGSLEPGKAADLVVLDRNLFEIKAQEISEARVLWTLVDGVEVFRAEGASF